MTTETPETMHIKESDMSSRPPEMTEAEKQRIIQQLDELAKLPDFHKVPLPKFYCDARGICWEDRHKPLSLKEVVHKQMMGELPESMNKAKKQLENKVKYM